jgi:hypothetical protein
MQIGPANAAASRSRSPVGSTTRSDASSAVTSWPSRHAVARRGPFPTTTHSATAESCRAASAAVGGARQDLGLAHVEHERARLGLPLREALGVRARVVVAHGDVGAGGGRHEVVQLEVGDDCAGVRGGDLGCARAHAGVDGHHGVVAADRHHDGRRSAPAARGTDRHALVASTSRTKRPPSSSASGATSAVSSPSRAAAIAVIAPPPGERSRSPAKHSSRCRAGPPAPRT